MHTMQLTESTDIIGASTRERTREGFLRVRANVTQAGVSAYRKDKMDDPRVRSDPNLPETIGLFRPLSVLEAEQTKESIKLKPVTYKHPPTHIVHKDNYTRHACGHIGDARVTHDGFLQVDMLIHDEDLIQKVQDGEMEVSIGTYPTVIKRENGTFDGRPYHFKVDKPLDINHVAVVEKGKGKAGSTVRILESTEDGDEPMNENDKQDIIKGVGEAITKALGTTKTEGDKGFDQAQFTASLTESIGDMFTKERERAEKEAKAAKEEAEKAEQVLKESTEAVNDRAEILVQAKGVMTAEAYEKVKDQPIKNIIQEALGDSVEGTDKMEEAELRGAFKVAIKQRMSESFGTSRVAPPASHGGTGGVNIKSGLDYLKYKNMNKGKHAAT